MKVWYETGWLYNLNTLIYIIARFFTAITHYKE